MEGLGQGQWVDFKVNILMTIRHFFSLSMVFVFRQENGGRWLLVSRFSNFEASSKVLPPRSLFLGFVALEGP